MDLSCCINRVQFFFKKKLKELFMSILLIHESKLEGRKNQFALSQCTRKEITKKTHSTMSHAHLCPTYFNQYKMNDSLYISPNKLGNLIFTLAH